MNKLYWLIPSLLLLIFLGCTKTPSLYEKENVNTKYSVLDLKKNKVRVIGDSKIYHTTDVVKKSFITKQGKNNPTLKKKVAKALDIKVKTKRNIRRFKVVGQPNNFGAVKIRLFNHKTNSY